MDSWWYQRLASELARRSWYHDSGSNKAEEGCKFEIRDCTSWHLLHRIQRTYDRLSPCDSCILQYYLFRRSNKLRRWWRDFFNRFVILKTLYVCSLHSCDQGCTEARHCSPTSWWAQCRRYKNSRSSTCGWRNHLQSARGGGDTDILSGASLQEELEQVLLLHGISFYNRAQLFLPKMQSTQMFDDAGAYLPFAEVRRVGKSTTAK